MSAPRGEGLESLPAHFHRERAVLREAGVCTWRRLAEVSPERLRELARPGAASEARLLRLRAQASLMVAADLAPEHASLLLHAGIAEPRALAEADPERLRVRVNRFWHRLVGPRQPPISLAAVRGWIQAASRSGN